MFRAICQNTLFKYYPDTANAAKEANEKAEAAAQRVRESYYGIEKRSHDKKALVIHKGKPVNAKTEESRKKDGDDEEKTGDWSAKEDKKFRALKTENTSWKDIAAELGRDVGQLKQRWKELQGSTAVVEEAVYEAKKADKTETTSWTTKQDKKLKTMHAAGTNFKIIGTELNKTPKEVADRARELGLIGKKKQQQQQNKTKAKEEESLVYTPSKKQKQKQQKGKNKAAQAEAEGAEAEFTKDEWRTINADDQFSLDELELLVALINARQDDEWSWRWLAASFYDHTGRRIDPADIRAKFVEMGAL